MSNAILKQSLSAFKKGRLLLKKHWNSRIPTWWHCYFCHKTAGIEIDDKKGKAQTDIDFLFFFHKGNCVIVIVFNDPQLKLNITLQPAIMYASGDGNQCNLWKHLRTHKHKYMYTHIHTQMWYKRLLLRYWKINSAEEIFQMETKKTDMWM